MPPNTMGGNIFRIGLLLSLTGVLASHAEIINTHGGGGVSGVHIECNTHDIRVTVSTGGAPFHGMIYPRGLSKNSSCLAEYAPPGGNGDEVVYSLPLRSCNTMNHDTEDGGVEFFNTVVVQPHSKLVTSLGRGFHVRCRYQMNKHANVPEEGLKRRRRKKEPLPNCHMKIYKGRMDEHVIAENVKIGDYLTLAISIDKQDAFGIHVTNCLVKDGLSESEEPLINNEGCPINEEIFGGFEYSDDLLSASVTYPAHKFPLTPSIYYQCNVKLCDKKKCAPPVCDQTGQNVLRRRKRESVEDKGDLADLRRSEEDARDKSVEVYSGLLVNEVEEEDDPRDDVSSSRSSSSSSESSDEFCLSTRKFAVGIAIAGVLLMLAVILLVSCIIFRRRRRKGSPSTSSSSVYSGPYSNHAYSRD